MSAASCASSSTGSAPATLTEAVDRLDDAVGCGSPPAALSLCWDGSAPAAFDAADPGKPRCPSPIAVPDGGLSMKTMAQLASRSIAWALDEQSKRLARADWSARCGGG